MINCKPNTSNSNPIIEVDEEVLNQLTDIKNELQLKSILDVLKEFLVAYEINSEDDLS